MITFSGHSFLTVELLKERLQEKLEQVGVEISQQEMCNWAEGHVIMPDERAGYEDDWPHPVVVRVTEDGTTTVESGT